MLILNKHFCSGQIDGTLRRLIERAPMYVIIIIISRARHLAFVSVLEFSAGPTTYTRIPAVAVAVVSTSGTHMR